MELYSGPLGQVPPEIRRLKSRSRFGSNRGSFPLTGANTKSGDGDIPNKKAMEKEEKAPFVGVMEKRSPIVYKYREPVQMCRFEISLCILSLQDSLRHYKEWRKDTLSSPDTPTAKKLEILESVQYREDLIARLERIQEDIFPLPF